MAQPQPQVPQRTFSPSSQMSAPSPGAHPTAFSTQPPAKKPRLSPAPSPQGLSQPGPLFSPLGPNHGSPITPGTPNSMASPTATPASAAQQHAPVFPMPSSASPSATASPVTLPSAPPTMTLPGGYHTSFTNGNGTATPTMPMPAGSPAGQVFSPKTMHSTPATPTGPPTPSGPPFPHIAPAPIHPSTTMNTFAPMVSSPAIQTPTGIMGPPSKPVDKPAKEYQYDVDDSLAGTGIDLRQEEQFQADYFAGTFRPEARTGFPANTPGRRSSFYGSLVANQPAVVIEDESQSKAATEAAKHAWEESAKALASTRGNALRNRFLEFNSLHARIDKIAREHSIGVILDPKSAPATTGRMRQDAEFPKPHVAVRTSVGPDGTLISTTGTFLPEDTYLADQLALVSLATKHRIRELLEDANKVATVRQQTSHGIVPEEWADAAAPLPAPGAGVTSNGENGSAGDSGTNPLKRPLETEDAAAAGAGATSAENVKKIATMNTLVKSLREVGKQERDLEEMRLRKRQKREGKLTDQTPSTPTGRSGTPATSGSVAPEPEKPPTKKELKKNAAAKAAEQNDTMSANRTSMAFLGGRKKKYSWMSGGGSGASTPNRSGLGGGTGLGGGGGGGGGGGAPGGPGAGPNSAAGRRPGEPMRLTGDGRTKMGAWREDTQKGKDIQLRDWVVVLEADGREAVALQDAYNRLDGPTTSRTG